MADDYFDDVPFVTTTKGTYPKEAATPPGALASGSFWTLFQRGDAFVVEYVSGEIAGRARSVTVSAEEAEKLKTADDDTAAAIINAHGGS